MEKETINVTLTLTKKDLEDIQYFLSKPHHESAKVKIQRKLKDWFDKVLNPTPKIEAYSEYSDYAGWSVEVYKDGIFHDSIPCKNKEVADETAFDINNNPNTIMI